MREKDRSNKKEYWRSLNQLADTPEFRELIKREFPESASEIDNSWSRRKFISLMGASIALAGLVSCRKPEEKIVPYVKTPEELVPGVPEKYATTMPFLNSAYGVVVESREGRPTKIEGNELHPSTRGASNSFMQAAILGLYDPDRSKILLEKEVRKSWYDFISFWRSERDRYRANGGRGLAILTEPFSSYSLSKLKESFHQTFPQAQWITYAPISDENKYRGIKIASGRAYQPIYHFENARVILSLDSDFLAAESESLCAAKGFAAGRLLISENDEMNRLYVVESRFSLTGGMADHRLRIQSRRIGAFLSMLILELNADGLSIPVGDNLSQFDAGHLPPNWSRAAAKDLISARGNSLVIAGRNQPPEVHALVLAVNEALGNIGETVTYRNITNSTISSTQEYRALMESSKRGEVSTLIILSGNPVYNTPSDANIEDVLKNIPQIIHLGSHYDETAKLSQWHIPEAHFLESWGDAQAVDGTPSVIQPLIEPLYDGHSNLEFLNLIVTGRDDKGYDIVRENWNVLLGGSNFQQKWQRVLHDGILTGQKEEEAVVKLNHRSISDSLHDNSFPDDQADSQNLEITFFPSSNIFDGRFANNGWLQELPDPVTKISWDNVAVISPKTASDLSLENEDLVWLNYGEHKVKAPVWIVPGWADYSISVAFGYGRKSAGKVGNGVGYNAYKIRAMDPVDIGIGATITNIGRKYKLANTQDHWSMEGRPIIREAALQYYRQHPEFAQEMVEHPPLKSLWEEHKYDEGYQWGMVIDLNACIGCGACSIACQSENNIPIVGKEQVRNGREMHWIRVDRYFSGKIEKPDMVCQPVPCMHCENAPCETVCPVNATVHDDEGLNVMTYNRCIGTRYCSNNCPYKVRRFNFFNYTSDTPESMKMANNPDVTVRSRGVMEKCTYCIQRINRAKIDAKRESREVRDGEIVTACQQACPVNAITFGSIRDSKSTAAKLKQSNRNYAMLEELNVKPRTTYLARIRNPNPELEPDD